MIHPNSKQVEDLLRRSALISGRKIITNADYKFAEEQLYFALNYEPVAMYPLSGTKKRHIGKTQPSKCRYCLRDASRTTFRQVAHAVPESLGNKTLISDDECDNCNDLFSRTFEHHLDLMTRPWRAFFGIKGKTKIPTYKLRSGTTRIDHKPQKRLIKISDPERNIKVTEDETNKSRKLEIPCDPFIPVEVFRAFIKIGLAILPNRYFNEYEAAFDWLRAPLEKTPAAVSRFAKCWTCFIPVPFENPLVAIFRRRSATDPTPSAICMISIFNRMFIYSVPLSHLDDHWRLEELAIPRGMIPLPAGMEPTWNAIDLRDRVPRSDFIHAMDQTFEESFPISKEEFDAD